MKKHIIDRSQAGVTIHRLVSDADPVEYIKAIKQETKRRIILLSGDDATLLDSFIDQLNALTDPNPELTTKIKNLRDASNKFESIIADMTADELDAVDVKNWDGWTA